MGNFNNVFIFGLIFNFPEVYIKKFYITFSIYFKVNYSQLFSDILYNLINSMFLCIIFSFIKSL